MSAGYSQIHSKLARDGSYYKQHKFGHVFVRKK